MNKILKYIFNILTKSEKKSVLIILCFMTVGMLLEMLGIGLIVPVIAILTHNDLISNYPSLQLIFVNIGHYDQKYLVMGVMLILFTAYLIKNTFLAFLAWRQAKFTFELQAELSKRLFVLYLSQPYTFHLQHNSAKLIRNIQNEVRVFISSAITPVMIVSTEGLVLAGICTLLLIVEPLGIFVVVLIFSVAAGIFHYATKDMVTQWGRARQHHDGLSLQHLHEGLGAAKDIKILGREKEFINSFGNHTEKSARMIQFQVTLRQIPRLWLELLGVAGLVGLVMTMMLQGKEIDAILPTLGLFAAAAFRLMPSVNRIIGAVQQFRFGIPAVHTLHEELNLTITDHPSAKTLLFESQIFINNVTYFYPDSSLSSLHDIVLEIKKGESIGIIGPSGSGKSTLVDIILGLLTPQIGQVEVDGHDISKNLRTWQDQIGYVPQTIYLTDDTLIHNVALGIPDDDIDKAAIKRAIKAAQLDKFVNTLPEKLDTVVGEHGVRLSGGQRQRIGIARALYHNPSVLVFDEATSALDTKIENEIVDEIKKFKRQKTTIIIAHRLSSVKHCDRIYRLEQGKVVQSGSYQLVIDN